MSKVYFLADTHWGHRNICKYRPDFKDNQEHDTAILNSITRRVEKRDTLWLLGDIFFDYALAMDLMDELSYIRNVRWVLGNHDAENNERQDVIPEAVQRGWKIYAMYKYKSYWLSHPPIHPDELRGKMNIHGHVHSATIDDARYVNVSCENTGFAPVSLETIETSLTSTHPLTTLNN